MGSAGYVTYHIRAQPSRRGPRDRRTFLRRIFDAFFPKAFRNWWSDDWISTVYGSRATFARRDVVVTHNVQSQKTGAWNRYDVDHAAQHALHSEVQKGFVTINACLLYTSPSPRDATLSRMPSSA